MSKKKKKTKNIFCKVLISILLLVSILLLGILYFINLIPINYYIIVLIILIVINLLLSIGIIKRKTRILSSIVSILYIILSLIIIVYESYTLVFLKNFGSDKNVVIDNYYVVVLKTSEYNEIDDLSYKTIGILDLDDEVNNEAVNVLNDLINYKDKLLSDSASLADSLLSKDVSAILIDEASHNLLLENYDNYQDKVNIIYEFSVKTFQKDITKSKNVTKESFNIYISGIDTYGKVTSVSRSDVNMVVSVNPKTKQISLVTIPRDYYVTLSGKNSKDKLTHAGIYGVETSVKTIENLLDIEINYYIKVNFTSLINIVNALDGIDVNSKYSFTTGIYDTTMKETYTFNKGMNHLDGNKALAFVRERHAFSDGDRARGENQMLVLEAMIKKCTSATFLKNYTKTLNALKDAFVTNITDDEITSLVKMQLNDNVSWDISTYEMDGTPSYEYTYSYKNQKLYVMFPSDSSISTAKEQINKVFTN